MNEPMIWLMVGFLILSIHSWFIMNNRGEILRLKQELEIEREEEKILSELGRKLSKDKANLEGLGDVIDES
ncbi:MAG: hypothetical protein ACTSPB_18960 [Candidatus Thorarchaeota archaeon]